MSAVLRLNQSHLPEVVAVMTDAFHDYPVMHFVVGPDGDVPARVRLLVELFVTRRQRRGGPMLGVYDPVEHTLVGAVAMTNPAEPDPPADLAAWVDDVWARLGPDARARYDHYASMWPQLEARPHHHLNMIGVRPGWHGRRVGRLLLDAVHLMAEEDPQSCGVSLTTERPRNVELYQHMGYRVIGQKPVAPGFETWGLFRASRSQPAPGHQSGQG